MIDVSRRKLLLSGVSLIGIGLTYKGIKKLNEKKSSDVDFETVVGRNILIYKWGSRTGGDDWCFIRTPDNYDPNGKPHEFVVLNHGNGWTMDGTEEKANFSSKTQFGVDDQNGGTYLDINRSDYVEYSSPLIEALLAEGFVVCGAQNDNGMPSDAAAGWGAREVRQNIRDFVDHMRKNYNVTRYCHMIGASNGGLATLNAAMIMDSHDIRSITLLYPVTNLYSAWKDTHRKSVESAYDIESDQERSFLSQTVGHDPMSSFTAYRFGDVPFETSDNLSIDLDAGSFIDGKKSYELTKDEFNKVKLLKYTTYHWPRIRCHYSLEDRVLDMKKHWLLFRVMLENSASEFTDLEVKGNHGSWEHFHNIKDIVDWVKK